MSMGWTPLECCYLVERHVYPGVAKCIPAHTCTLSFLSLPMTLVSIQRADGSCSGCGEVGEVVVAVL